VRRNAAEATLKAVLVPLFWSLVFPLSKVVMPVVPPITLVVLRYSAGALFLAVVSIASGRREEMARLLRDRWPSMFMLGFIAVASYASQVIALIYASTAEGAIIASTAPVYAAVMAAVFLRERIGANQIGGLVLSLAGVAGIALVGEQTPGSNRTLGAALMFFGAVTYSVYTVLGKKLEASSAPVLAVSTGLGVIPFLLWAAFTEPLLPSLATATASTWATLAALGALPTGLAVVWYFGLVSRLGAARASTVSYMVPVFGLIQSGLLLHEAIGPAVFLGGTACLAGVALAQRQARGTPSSTLRQ
jgi:drug/metabolite transporter (DMT)-like permease